MANNTFANNNAHNIANVNTDNFIPTDTRIVDGGNGAITASSPKADNQNSTSITFAPSQTDLAVELTDQVQIEAINEVNINAIRTKDEMLGTLLDLKV
jgi:flagellar basal body rod protein FlgB